MCFYSWWLWQLPHTSMYEEMLAGSSLVEYMKMSLSFPTEAVRLRRAIGEKLALQRRQAKSMRSKYEISNQLTLKSMY